MCGLMFKKRSEEKLYKYIKHNLNYKISSRFGTLISFQMLSKLPSIDKFTKAYLERWFTVFVETGFFLDMDYALVRKLFSSSNLNITSETEVFDAADAWISHNTKHRRKHAKSLLLQVRFSLLSGYALNHALRKTSSFRQVEECSVIIDDVLNGNIVVSHKPKNYSTNRSCTQPISMSAKLLNARSVCYKGKVITFNRKTSVEKYFPASNKINTLVNYCQNLKKPLSFQLMRFYKQNIFFRRYFSERYWYNQRLLGV